MLVSIMQKKLTEVYVTLIYLKVKLFGLEYIP